MALMREIDITYIVLAALGGNIINLLGGIIMVKCSICGLVIPQDHAIYLASVEIYYCKKCAIKYKI